MKNDMKEEQPSQIISTIGSGVQPPEYSKVYGEFNSTTKLADDYSDDYNPFDHRKHENPTSTGGALAHLLKGSLGTGILAMPLAFSNAGLLFGSLATIIVGALCLHCMTILVATSHKMCKLHRVPVLGFSQTAEKVFESGPPGVKKYSRAAKLFVDYALLATYYSICCVYIVFIANTFHDIINTRAGLDWDVRIYILIVAIPVLLISQVKSLRLLVPFSTISNIFILITFGITLYYMFDVELHFDDKELVADVTKWPLFFSTVIFAMEGIGAIMPVENSMSKPEHFLGCRPGVLNIAMITLVILYAIMGFFGYVRFGDKTEGSVTLNLDPNETAALIAQILIGLAILFTFGLQFFIPSDILERKLSKKIPKNKKILYEGLLRAGITVVLVIIAIAVPELEPFIGLVGAIFLSTLGIFTPAVIQVVHQSSTGYGFMKWKLIKNCFLMVFAFVALTTGSYSSVLGIINIYTKEESKS